MRLKETKASSNKDLSSIKINYVCERKDAENQKPKVNYSNLLRQNL